jgi:hypothetical protein
VKKTIRLVLTTVGLIIPFGMLSSFSYAADAPTPPALMETYLCNLKPGKDVDDVLAARDNLVKQSKKAGLAVQDSYVWSHFKGDSQADLIWHSIYGSVAEWAAETDAAMGNPEMAGVNAKFDEAVDCRAVIATLNPIHVGKAELPERTFVSAYTCQVKHGINRQDVGDLVTHLQEVIAAQGDAAPGFVGLVEPMTDGPNIPDVVLFNVSESVSAWAEFMGGVQADGGMLGRHFNATLDCSLNLYGSRQVIDAG